VNCDPKKHVIRPEFVRLNNWPLRGLFWLAKDFFDPDLQEVMEPDAKAVYVIRNCLEHSYLKVHEMLIPNPEADSARDAWTDRLAYSVRRSDFEGRTLKLIKLARAAMIYLSLGMHKEEHRRRGGDTKMVGPMPLHPWPDKFKR
jgi:LA2681-like HEPN